MSEQWAISEIRVGKRHRTDLGDVVGLGASIRENGLLHPIVVRPDGLLIAGERRLAACKALGWADIPVTILDMKHLVFGEQAENIDRIVALIMRSCGYFIIPSYDYGGSDGNKAPKMQGPKLALVIPDLDVVRGGKRHWVEVKTKDHADFTRMTGQFEHGIDLRHFEHYQRVESESGCDVVVSVFEESTGDVLAATLRRIGKAGRLSPRFNCGRGGYFWPRSVMTLIASVSRSGGVYDICVLSRLASNPGFRWTPIRENFEDLKFRLTDRPSLVTA